MSQLQYTLQQAAHKNTHLLAELRQTDHAPSSLKQNSAYISDLQSQIATTAKELRRLHTITEDERKDHLKYRDSSFKRYLHKAGGSKGQEKFTSRQEKEEKEFLEAWQAERSARETHDELASALQQAERDKSNLENATKRHDAAQIELDQLYHSIFSGPTPDFPGEDDLERAVSDSKESFDIANRQATTDKLVLGILDKADSALKQAGMSMQDALRRSQRDMFLGGGSFTDMMERDALAQAQNWIHQTLRHMGEARRMQPQVRELKDISIDHGHFFSDVLFDNIFTDMAQHDRIRSSDAQLGAAYQDLQGQIREQKNRCLTANQNLKQAGNDLEAARIELQRVRGEAFERPPSGTATAQEPPPPQYTA